MSSEVIDRQKTSNGNGLVDSMGYRQVNTNRLAAVFTGNAIAPLCEVKTAKLQAQAGAADAGLSEEERAAKAGCAAALDSAYAKAKPLSKSDQSHPPVGAGNDTHWRLVA